jgi:hypothetical protein
VAVGAGVAVGVGPAVGGGVGEGVGATVGGGVEAIDLPCPPGGEATGTGRSGFLGNGEALDEGGRMTRGAAVWPAGGALWSTVGAVE